MTSGSLRIVVNPDRQGSGIASFWGFITGGLTCPVFNGDIDPLNIRWAKSLSFVEARNKMGFKHSDRGSDHVDTFQIPPGVAHAEFLKSLLEEIWKILVAAKKGGVLPPNTDSVTISAKKIGTDAANRLSTYAAGLGLIAAITS